MVSTYGKHLTKCQNCGEMRYSYVDWCDACLDAPWYVGITRRVRYFLRREGLGRAFGFVATGLVLLVSFVTVIELAEDTLGLPNWVSLPVCGAFGWFGWGPATLWVGRHLFPKRKTA